MADVLKRTTFIVRDAECAAYWYEQVLGMTDGHKIHAGRCTTGGRREG